MTAHFLLAPLFMHHLLFYSQLIYRNANNEKHIFDIMTLSTTVKYI